MQVIGICQQCGRDLTEDNIAKNTRKQVKKMCNACYEKKQEFLKGRRVALAGFRAMPLEAKILKSKILIEEAIREFGKDKVYVSYSGGKDSTVLSHIAKQVYPDILHIFSNTTCEYPETLKHVKWEKEENGTNIITVLPKDSRGGGYWNFKKVVENYGFPMFSKSVSRVIRGYRNAQSEEVKNRQFGYMWRMHNKYVPYKDMNISDRCCDKLKKAPAKKKAKELGLECSILGILAEESRAREQDWLENGCNVFHTRQDNQCRPLEFWTEKDIYEYIDKFNVKIADLYKMGYKRNGCMYCGFGVQLEKEPNRWQQLAKTHPRQYQYFIRNFENLIKQFDVPYKEIIEEEGEEDSKNQ